MHLVDVSVIMNHQCMVTNHWILKWIFKKGGGEAWTGFIWLRLGAGECGACECGNELWGYEKCGEFLGWLRTC
jgi:hypothetical protein